MGRSRRPQHSAGDRGRRRAGGPAWRTRRWSRLQVVVPWPVEAASLLTSPSGHLTNLSTTPDDASGREGFVRVINRSRQAGEAEVVAVDDGGARIGLVEPITGAVARLVFGVAAGWIARGLLGRDGGIATSRVDSLTFSRRSKPRSPTPPGSEISGNRCEPVGTVSL